MDNLERNLGVTCLGNTSLVYAVGLAKAVPISRPRKLGNDMGEDETRIRNCSFEFQCNAKWDELAEISGQNSERVKHCGRCGKNVFRPSGYEELYENINANNCVALDAKLFRGSPWAFSHTTLGVMRIDGDENSPDKEAEMVKRESSSIPMIIRNYLNRWRKH